MYNPRNVRSASPIGIPSLLEHIAADRATFDPQFERLGSQVRFALRFPHLVMRPNDFNYMTCDYSIHPECEC